VRKTILSQQQRDLRFTRVLLIHWRKVIRKTLTQSTSLLHLLRSRLSRPTQTTASKVVSTADVVANCDCPISRLLEKIGNESRRTWTYANYKVLLTFKGPSLRVGPTWQQIQDVLFSTTVKQGTHSSKHCVDDPSFFIFKPHPTIGVSDKHSSLADPCRVVGTVHLHKHWPAIRFPQTVAKCDTIQTNRYLYKQTSFVTSCRLAHCIALGWLSESATTALSQRLRQQAPWPIAITGAFLKHTSRADTCLYKTYLATLR
jgi:hypothetical protein